MWTNFVYDSETPTDRVHLTLRISRALDQDADDFFATCAGCCPQMLNVVYWGAMHRAVGFQALHPVYEGDTLRQTGTHFDGSEIHTAAFQHVLQVMEPLRNAFVLQNSEAQSTKAEMEYLSAAGQAIAHVKSACMSRMRLMREGPRQIDRQ